MAFLALLVLLAALASFTNQALTSDVSKNVNMAAQPPTNEGSPVKVNVSLFVVSLSQLEQSASGSFRAQLYLRQRWVDPRLSTQNKASNSTFLDNLNGHQSTDGRTINLRGKEVEKIWKPDTFIPNVRSMAHQQLISSSMGGGDAEFCKVDQITGEVFISKMLDLTAGCSMNFAAFPFDTQSCTIEFESYGYSAADILYQWVEPKGKAIGFVPGLEVDVFRLSGYKVFSVTEQLSTGSYSRVTAEFLLERKSFGHYLATLYLPTLILVAFTWIPMNVSGTSKSNNGVFVNRMIFLAVLLLGFLIVAASHWHTVPFISGSLTNADHFLLLSLLLFVLAFINTARKHCLFTRISGSTLSLPSYSDAVKVDLNETEEAAKGEEKAGNAGESVLMGKSRFSERYNNFFLPLSALVIYSYYIVLTVL